MLGGEFVGGIGPSVNTSRGLWELCENSQLKCEELNIKCLHNSTTFIYFGLIGSYIVSKEVIIYRSVALMPVNGSFYCTPKLVVTLLLRKMVATHVAAGSCRRWSVVLHFYSLWVSGKPRGLWLVCSECWVVVQEQPANAPAVQQCISLINSAALTVHGTSPLKKTTHKSLGSNGAGQGRDSRQARKGQNFERMAGS